jgi:hypothetical protein
MFFSQMGHIMPITYLPPTSHLQFYNLPTYPPTHLPFSYNLFTFIPLNLVVKVLK